MFYSTLPVVSEKVEAEAVIRRVNFVFEFSSKQDELSGVERAFEHRFLYTLSIVLTSRGNAAEPALSRFALRRDIVSIAMNRKPTHGVYALIVVILNPNCTEDT